MKELPKAIEGKRRTLQGEILELHKEIWLIDQKMATEKDSYRRDDLLTAKRKKKTLINRKEKAIVKIDEEFSGQLTIFK